MMGGASKADEQSNGDLARRKEDALVILLYGYSGVGKKFTSGIYFERLIAES